MPADVCAGRSVQSHALDRHADHCHALFVVLAELLHFDRLHVAIDRHTGLVDRGETCVLNGAGGFDALTFTGRGFATVELRELLHGHARHFQLNADAVEDGAADALLIFLDHCHCASALLLAILKKAARAGIDGCNSPLQQPSE